MNTKFGRPAVHGHQSCLSIQNKALLTNDHKRYSRTFHVN